MIPEFDHIPPAQFSPEEVDNFIMRYLQPAFQKMVADFEAELARNSGKFDHELLAP